MPTQVEQWKPDDPQSQQVEMEGATGASDGNSGGGAGAGIPGGGTDMRTNGRFDGGNVEEDKKNIFPEATDPDREQSS